MKVFILNRISADIDARDLEKEIKSENKLPLGKVDKRTEVGVSCWRTCSDIWLLEIENGIEDMIWNLIMWAIHRCITGLNRF